MIAREWPALPKTFNVFRVTGIAFLIGCSQAPSDHPLQKPDPGHTIKVFILAGQSNMEGRADGTLLTPEDRQRLAATQDRVQLAFNEEPIRVLDVVKPSEEIAKSYHRDLIFGPELFFGITLAEAWPNERILLIKLAQGGASLHGCWNPNWDADKAALMEEEDEPALYDTFIDYVRDVLSGFDQDEYELCAMLWVQGESDAENETAATAYGDTLETLIKQTRHDVSDDQLPFLFFQVGHGDVLEGMNRVAREVQNATLLTQNPDPAAPDYYPTMENGHYNHKGMKKLGRRFAETYLSQHR